MGASSGDHKPILPCSLSLAVTRHRLLSLAAGRQAPGLSWAVPTGPFASHSPRQGQPRQPQRTGHQGGGGRVLAPTQQQAQMMTMPIMLPSMMLSGFIFPMASLPLFLQAVGYMLPLTYFIIILRSLVIKGAGLELLIPQTFVLIGFSIVLLTLAALRFKKSLD